MSFRRERDGLVLDDAVDRLDLGVIHGFLTGTYWSEGIPMDAVARAIEHSLAFGLYDGERQIGFCRLVTDRVHFAYLADVFVLPGYRGRGLARWMTAQLLEHPELVTVRRWLLATRDAHDVYAAAGYAPLADPERYMTLRRRQPWNPPDAAPLAP